MTTAAELRAEARRLARLAREAEVAEARALMAAREARKPKEPPIGTVIAFSKAMSGREYHYAALSFPVGTSGNRTMRRWAVTNTVRGEEGRYTWAGLLDFIGEANWTTLRVATEWNVLVEPEDEPAVKETVGPYGKVTSTELVEPYLGKATPFGGPYGG
jgi:hypothetical protein